MHYDILTLAERPELAQEVNLLHQQAWPPFLLQNTVSRKYGNDLLTRFSDCQLVLLEGEKVVGAANSVPIHWVGALEDLPEGRDAAWEKGFHDLQKGERVTTLVGLSIIISPDYRGKNLSRMMVSSLKDMAVRKEFQDFLVPLRPVWKSRFPKMQITDYLRQAQSDGLPMDPWVRTHLKLGAKFITIAPKSIVVTGTIPEWEQWTGMTFSESGTFTVPGGLVPVRMDRNKNEGRYEEPNIWVRYRLAG